MSRNKGSDGVVYESDDRQKPVKKKRTPRQKTNRKRVVTCKRIPCTAKNSGNRGKCLNCVGPKARQIPGNRNLCVHHWYRQKRAVRDADQRQ